MAEDKPLTHVKSAGGKQVLLSNICRFHMSDSSQLSPSSHWFTLANITLIAIIAIISTFTILRD
jgi:hypothetical protein